MTTEIAIMNKSAVALAADSAVTISLTSQQGRGVKVLNSANKLFALSKHAPIGLMSYGNASLLGIPWETIIKMYRIHLGAKTFSTVEEYCKNFFNFMDAFPVDERIQKIYVANGALGLFKECKDMLDKWVHDNIKNKKPITTKEIEIEFENIINKQYKQFQKIGKKSIFSAQKRSSLRIKYNTLIDEIIAEIFGNFPITEQIRTKLLAIAINAASMGPQNQSGIVIAGFGDKEIFPSCYSYNVASIFSGKTIKHDGSMKKITHDMGSSIMPFAQSDDVHTFMCGLGPKLAKFLNSTFKDIMINGLPNQLCNQIINKFRIDASQKNDLQNIIINMCKGAYDFAFDEFRKQQSIHYVNPVVKATEFLNKSELAAMAETLVNLVSFRKQVTMEAETVGGPIDVAVITKGDGLIWIKRKHYFQPDLNPQFFNNNYPKGN